MTILNSEILENFSYAEPDDPWLRRFLIRAIERISGQPYLKRLYDEHRTNPRPGESFWNAAIRLLELKIVYNEEALTQIPRSGPLVIVANHPFGVLDGIIIGYLASKVRSDFRVLTNSVFYRTEEIRRFLLPIDFGETREAMATNLQSRAEARAHLAQGGCLIVFPAGGASTTPNVWSSRAIDTEWKTLTAGLMSLTKASVVPIYFAGQNSRLFQIASHISTTFRLSLFFKEVRGKIGSEIRLRIGEVIPYEKLAELDRKAFMEHLRAATYALAATTPAPPRHRRHLRRTLRPRRLRT